jgi:hypothetical protein
MADLAGPWVAHLASDNVIDSPKSLTRRYGASVRPSRAGTITTLSRQPRHRYDSKDPKHPKDGRSTLLRLRWRPSMSKTVADRLILVRV